MCIYVPRGRAVGSGGTPALLVRTGGRDRSRHCKARVCLSTGTRYRCDRVRANRTLTAEHACPRVQSHAASASRRHRTSTASHGWCAGERKGWSCCARNGTFALPVGRHPLCQRPQRKDARKPPRWLSCYAVLLLSTWYSRLNSYLVLLSEMRQFALIYYVGAH